MPLLCINIDIRDPSFLVAHQRKVGCSDLPHGEIPVESCGHDDSIENPDSTTLGDTSRSSSSDSKRKRVSRARSVFAKGHALNLREYGSSNKLLT